MLKNSPSWLLVLVVAILLGPLFAAGDDLVNTVIKHGFVLEMFSFVFAIQSQAGTEAANGGVL